jgi:hypothetical protein
MAISAIRLLPSMNLALCDPMRQDSRLERDVRLLVVGVRFRAVRERSPNQPCCAQLVGCLDSGSANDQRVQLKNIPSRSLCNWRGWVAASEQTFCANLG